MGETVWFGAKQCKSDAQWKAASIKTIVEDSWSPKSDGVSNNQETRQRELKPSRSNRSFRGPFKGTRRTTLVLFWVKPLNAVAPALTDKAQSVAKFAIARQTLHERRGPFHNSSFTRMTALMRGTGTTAFGQRHSLRGHQAENAEPLSGYGPVFPSGPAKQDHFFLEFIGLTFSVRFFQRAFRVTIQD